MLAEAPSCSSLYPSPSHLTHGACLPHPATPIFMVLPCTPLCPGLSNIREGSKTPVIEFVRNEPRWTGFFKNFNFSLPFAGNIQSNIGPKMCFEW